MKPLTWSDGHMLCLTNYNQPVNISTFLSSDLNVFKNAEWRNVGLFAEVVTCGGLQEDLKTKKQREEMGDIFSCEYDLYLYVGSQEIKHLYPEQNLKL